MSYEHFTAPMFFQHWLLLYAWCYRFVNDSETISHFKSSCLLHRVGICCARYFSLGIASNDRSSPDVLELLKCHVSCIGNDLQKAGCWTSQRIVIQLSITFIKQMRKMNKNNGQGRISCRNAYKSYSRKLRRWQGDNFIVFVMEQL